jgi:hypothetical protein
MTRVGPGEIAILTSVLHPENDLRVCQVIAQLDDESGYSETVWWLCEFTRPVKTFLGWMHFACIPDNDCAVSACAVSAIAILPPITSFCRSWQKLCA